jgi:FkbM family methyltransferase
VIAIDYKLAFAACQKSWESRRYVPLTLLTEYAKALPLVGSFEDNLLLSCKSFNCSDDSLTIINSARDEETGFGRLALKQYLSDNILDQAPYDRISAERFTSARDKLFESPEMFMTLYLERYSYPYYAPGKTYGYHPKWVTETTCKSKELFSQFSASRCSNTAVLVGNGPSLNKIDFDLFRGQDVFVSNYAIKNESIAKYAKGVAVTNYLVAEQEPYWFQLNQLWKFYPIWLAGTMRPSDTSILLNAIGGKLFYSKDVTTKVAWHSTVTYFWLQILYSAGYKKVVMTGFDHFYHQEASAKEGDLIKQTTDDKNHFDPNYFKGKNWQAADVSKMEETYRLAKQYYEADGREIVNATVGGHLEVFRRSVLSKEVDRPRLFGRVARPDPKAKVAIITAFWKGDVAQAELHWRLINRLGVPSIDHIYVFKHHKNQLLPTTLPRVVCADIENEYPEAAKLLHPAGPNLVFAHTVRMLLDTQYTHFFWLEPDCIPTDRDWLKPFIDRLSEYPEEPIIGTGGGTVTPGKLHWRNHFAGCSLYSLKHLAEIDWDGFIKNHLHVSFDIWLSVNLGYIKLGCINNADQATTIIYGKDRHDWSELRKPKSLVYGMFEHWRPEKVMTPDQFEERLSWPSFSLYHAVKDRDVVVRLFKKLPKSASTIIINYNNEKYLFDAIESALNQELVEIKYEVIVVDDGSTDSSNNIIDSFGDRIKAVYLTHGILNGNFNQQRALKAGLDIALGEVLLLLDGDDLFFPDKVQSFCEVFDDPEVVLAQHTLNLIDGNGTPMGKVFKAFPVEAIKPETYQKLRRVNLYQATSGLAFRRSYIQSQLDKLCVDDHINTWLDVRLTRFSPYFGKVYSSDKRLGAWRRHASSDSIRIDNVAERIQGHEKWFDQVSARGGYPAVPFKWKEESCLVGPYSRDDHAHWDETIGIRQFTISNKSGTMIDVGAHEGYALMPFLNDGWNILAFEPDNKNRGKLFDRLKKHKNKHLVSLDTRCVSNKSQKGVSFFTSEQSTGISGLSAFHETHVEAQKVDITTLTEFFEDKPLPAVDFLKIDTEGHDLFVLQGFPWERGKPAVIECEFEDTKTVPLGYTFHDLARYLVDKGYTVYVSEWHPIIRYGIRHDWNQLLRYPCELADTKGWGNLLAFRDPIDEQALVVAVKKVLKVGAGDTAQKVAKPAVSPKPVAAMLPAPVAPMSGALCGFRVEPGPNFATIAPNQWRYTHSDAKQKLWVAAVNALGQMVGRGFVGSLRVMVDRAMTVDVSLGRHGNSKYEGTNQRITLAPGVMQSVKLGKRFDKAHTALKLQVDVIDLCPVAVRRC